MQDIDGTMMIMLLKVKNLNTIEEDGYTEFIDATRVRAKEGRIVIFPSGWTFLHRGYPPKNQRKYICTGWLHAK